MKQHPAKPSRSGKSAAERAQRGVDFDVRYRELFNHMNSGVAVYRPIRQGADFLIVDFNRAAERIERVRAKDVIGKPVTRVFPGVGAMGIMKAFRRVARTGKAEHFPDAIYVDRRIKGWRDNYIYRLPGGEVVAVYDDTTAQRQALERLEMSEKRFRSIVENVNDGFMIHDFRGLISDCNDTICLMLGYRPGELIGMRLKDIDGPDNMKAFRVHMDQMLREGKVYFDGTHVKKDGSLLDTNISARLVSREGNGLIQSFMRDISWRKGAEKRLRASEARFRSIVEHVNDGFVIHDFTGNILDCNDNACRLFGVPREKLVGSSILDLGDGETRERLPAHLKSVIKEGSCEFIATGPAGGGAQLHLSVSSRIVEREAPGRVQSFLRDITGQVQAERALQDEKGMLEGILEATLAGYWDWDMERGREHLSPRLKEMLGYRPEEMPNRPEAWKRLVHPDDLPGLMDCIDRHVRTGGRVPFYDEVRFRRKDGTTAWMTVAGRVVRWSPDGKPLRMVGCHIDITERKRAEAVSAEKDARYRSMVQNMDDGVVVHDFAGNIIEASDSLCRMLGHPPGWLDGKNLQDIMMTGREGALESLLARLRRDEHLATDAYLRRADGSALPVDSWIRVVSRLGGGVVQGVIRDLTERRKMEDELRRGMEVRQTLLEYLPCMAMILRKSTREIVFSNALARNAGALPGRKCHEVWRDIKEPCPWCRAPDSWETGKPVASIVEYRGKKYDCLWMPLGEDLYVHYIHEIPKTE